ncbi:hypothetical protein Tco_1104610 [Tanacetum coccineum]
MDVKTAFLNGVLREEARHAWYELLSKFLLTQKFSKGSVEPTLFMRKYGKNILLMLMMGKMYFFLGLQISQSPGGIFINQSKYALEILKKYGMESSDPVDIPMVERTKLDDDLQGIPIDLGSISCLTSSRPDLGLLDTAYWIEIVLLQNVDQSILYGVSADVDMAYSSKSDNGLRKKYHLSLKNDIPPRDKVIHCKINNQQLSRFNNELIQFSNYLARSDLLFCLVFICFIVDCLKLILSKCQDLSHRWCMTQRSTKELLSPLKNPKRVLCSRRKLFYNPSLVELNPPEDDQTSKIKEHIEEEVIQIMAETMEQYMSKTREDYESGVTRPTINQDTPFESKGKVFKELRDNTFSGSEQEDANEHIEKVLKIVDLFHIPKVTQDQIMLRAFPVSLIGAASRWLRNQPSGSITTWEVLKTKSLNKYCPPACTAKKIEEINNFQQEPDESLFRAWERFKELLMMCPQHYLTDMQEVILFYNGLNVPTRQILDSKGAIPSKTVVAAKTAIQEMAEYSQKWHNRASSRTKSTETSDGLATIQAQLNNLGRHEENSNIIKEIRASTDAAIRNQGASIKTLELQIGQMSKVLQERGFRSLPGSTETNPRDQVKSISTAIADLFEIHCIEYGPYAEAHGANILDAYDDILPQKEKDPGSFTLPCLINNICFDKALVDLGASVSVMPFSTYTNLGLGDLSHTRMAIELADRTIKQPKGIATNVLVRIGKFVFPIDFVILDIPEDNDVPLILG